MEGWARPTEAAKHASVSVELVRMWLKNGLKHSRVSERVVLIKYAHLDDYLDSLQVDTQTEQRKLDYMVDKAVKEMLT